MRQILPKLLLAPALLLSLALSTQAHADSPVGVWKGRWSSTTTGHSGPLRARIWTDGSGRYQARFSGRFALVIPFTYRTTLTPDCCGNLVSTRKMPIVGTYRTSANVYGNQFRANFSSGRESGLFRMTRRR